MNITLTVRGALEEDAALQEIVSILYRKASEARGEIEAGAPQSEETGGNAHVPAPKPGIPALSADAAEEPQPLPGAPAEPEPSKAAAPEKPAVEFETVRKAASEAINRGKRAELAALLKSRGVSKLAQLDEVEYPALLPKIEAL